MFPQQSPFFQPPSPDPLPGRMDRPAGYGFTGQTPAPPARQVPAAEFAPLPMTGPIWSAAGRTMTRATVAPVFAAQRRPLPTVAVWALAVPLGAVGVACAWEVVVLAGEALRGWSEDCREERMEKQRERRALRAKMLAAAALVAAGATA